MVRRCHVCTKMSGILYHIVLKSKNVSTHCPVLTLCMKKKICHHIIKKLLSLSEKKIPIFCCLNLFVSVPKCLTHCTRLSKKVTKCHHIVEELFRLYLKKSRCLIVWPFCLCTKMSCTMYHIIQKGHKVSVHSQVVTLSKKILVYGKKQTIKPWSDVVMSVPKCPAYCTISS